MAGEVEEEVDALLAGFQAAVPGLQLEGAAGVPVGAAAGAQGDGGVGGVAENAGGGVTAPMRAAFGKVGKAALLGGMQTATLGFLPNGGFDLIAASGATALHCASEFVKNTTMQADSRGYAASMVEQHVTKVTAASAWGKAMRHVMTARLGKGRRTPVKGGGEGDDERTITLEDYLDFFEGLPGVEELESSWGKPWTNWPKADVIKGILLLRDLAIKHGQNPSTFTTMGPQFFRWAQEEAAAAAAPSGAGGGRKRKSKANGMLKKFRKLSPEDRAAFMQQAAAYTPSEDQDL